MNPSIHLDLLKDDERFSSSPVRLRVMMPMLALFAALSMALWWSLLLFRNYNQVQLKVELEKNIAELKPAHAALLALRAQERDTAATIRHIQFYQNARLRFGETLLKLAQCIPENMQLTELRVPPPPPVLIDPLRPALGPTNSVEQVSLRLAGRTTGERSSDAVTTLLAALQKPAFTNLIRSAEIPKGAFRQDFDKSSANQEMLLFELTCVCSQRRFE